MVKDVQTCVKGVGGVSLALVLVGCLAGVIVMADADEERTGGAAAERFGFVVKAMGDLNADGHHDFVVTAPNPGHDKTYIHFGPHTPEPFGDDTPPRLVFQGRDRGEAGWSVSSGNVSGQGNDLIVGAPGEMRGNGIVYVVRARPPKKAPAFGEVIIGPQHAYAQLRGDRTLAEYAGWSVASGDLNGDGQGDLIVGACSGVHGGRVYVVHGPVPAGSSDLIDVADTIIEGRDDHGLFGCALTVGDLNNDGRDDLVVGAHQERPEPGGIAGWGRVHVFYDVPSGEFSSEDLANRAVLVGTHTSNLGYSLDARGDLNGDGIDDLVMGAPASYCHRINDTRRPEACEINPVPRVYALLGRKGGAALRGEHGVVDKADVVLVGRAKNTEFGISVSTGGDLNGDGRDDLLIGTRDQNAAYLFYGAPHPQAEYRYNQAQATFDGAAEGLLAGFSVDIASDLNGDGLGDVLIGAPDQEWFGIDVGQESGRAYVFYGEE